MTKRGEVYKCEICGNIVEVLHEGQGELVCCGQPMKKQDEKTEDPEKGEKHIPIVEGNMVKVGSINHPMTEEHYIEWIEATNGKETTKIFLKSGQEPKAEFPFEPISARAYCNLHGLWKG
ncbi:desulfoferrodoxin [Candidatus Pacearchaeota archaeon]|nr:desulfoferrodoxin [Candidatus Pacearchaeota archaeon]|tara:strand:- start:4925 stop:5284 length:360 start_codon:yes stop_codon:yes gene_type:complete